jgi:hypothetical protein
MQVLAAVQAGLRSELQQLFLKVVNHRGFESDSGRESCSGDTADVQLLCKKTASKVGGWG